MARLKSVLEKWDLLPSKKRSGRLAKKMAKTVILKSAGVFGKKYLKSMGEARFLQFTQDCITHKRINVVKYEAEKWLYRPKTKTYNPDFRLKVGYTYHTVEYKGKMNGPVRTKLKDIKRCNPGKSLILVFERGNNKLNSKSKTTYMQWAERYGFPAFNTQDSEWKKQLVTYLLDNSELIKEV